jgi:hypothetical protein
LAWFHVLILTTVLVGQTPSTAGAPNGEKQPAGSSETTATSTTQAKPAESAPSKTGKKPEESTASGTKQAAKPAAPAAHPRRPVAGSDGGPRVLTQSEMQRPRSPFLSPPSYDGESADRYNPGGPDWSEIPPWRQTSFFGIRAQGQFFVYVVDCSGSMIDDDRLVRATIELRRSVMALRAPQRFEVIFYNDESIPMPGGPRPRPADHQAKSLLLAWLRLIEPVSGTDPRLSLRQALGLRPDAVFLLSDGAYPDGTVAEVARINRRKVPIHCIDLAGGLAGDHLKRIAQESGGRYASRPGDLHGRP